MTPTYLSRLALPLAVLVLAAGCGRRAVDTEKPPARDKDARGLVSEDKKGEEKKGEDDRGGPGGKRYALVVGVRQYDHDTLGELRFTENDAEELAAVLKDDRAANFSRVVLLSSTRGEKDAAARPTAANFRRELKAILDRVTKRDLVLVALAGHGLQMRVTDPETKNDREESFFCTTDAKPRDTKDLAELSKTMVPLGELFKELEQSGAGVKLMLVDACRNEPRLGRKVDVARVPPPPRGSAALFSCKSGEQAFESAKLGKGHGVFFHYVIEGLKGKARDEEGEITWSRLSEYVVKRVVKDVETVVGDGAKQTPHEIRNLEGGTPVLVAAPAAKGKEGDVVVRDGGKKDRTEKDGKDKDKRPVSPKGKGWVRLFNGMDLQGWKTHPRGTGNWAVDDGELTCSGPLSHLFTERGDYKDFHLRVECKINDKGNSGLCYRARFAPGFGSGYEAQIAVGGDTIKTGSIYPNHSWTDAPKIRGFAFLKPPHKANEWFLYEVICRGDRATLKVNGNMTADWKDPLHRYESGHFALQHHSAGTRVRFRKVEVKELPEK